MRNIITLTHDFTKELNETDVQERIQDTNDINLRILLQEILVLQCNTTILLASTIQQINHARQTWVIQGERTINGEFNLLIVDGYQVKKIDTLKFVIFELVVACLTLAAESITNQKYRVLGIIGVVIGASVKTAFDFNTYPSDVIYGYVIRYSQNKNLLETI